MIYSRISKIKDFDNVICGRDLDNILNEGHVYALEKIGGIIMLKDLGDHALMEMHAGQAISAIMINGSHLLTNDEYKLKQEYLKGKH